MPQNFPKVWKKTNAQVQESQRVPKKMDLKRSTPTDVILKSEKLENFKGSKIKKKKLPNLYNTIHWFSIRNFRGQMERQNILKNWKEKMYNQNTLSSKVIIQIERERKNFLVKEKKMYWPYKKC